MTQRNDVNARILLVDDDRIHSRILQARLEQADHRVEVASSGAAALERLQAEAELPEVILCDWVMEGMDGLALCRHVKGDPELANIHFILLTSLSRIEDRVEGLDAGADDFLSKPVDTEELLARVRSGLRLHRANEKLSQLARDLQRQQKRLDAELAEAADYVRSQLPPPLDGAVRADALFQPSQRLGGDSYDYFWIDADHFAFYVMDVSGHGLAAALPSISLLQRLRSEAGRPGLLEPERLLERLNDEFRMEDHDGRYFTIWYGVYETTSRRLRFASAGHPPALLMGEDPQELPRTLGTGGMAIGLFAGSRHREATADVGPGATLLLVSDGIYEIPLPDGSTGTLPEFLEGLPIRSLQQEDGLGHLLAGARERMKGDDFPDDVSLLRIRFS
jgi:sigma-B regulation protein RsbU (phosphoserine phosphatase)